MAFTMILPLLLLLMMMHQLVTAEYNGWNLDMACQSVGEVSKAYFSYRETELPVAFVLTADWGEEAQQDAVVTLGGTEGFEEEYGFSYKFQEPGTHALSFTFELESETGEKVTTRIGKNCEISAAAAAAPPAASTPVVTLPQDDSNPAADAAEGDTTPEEEEEPERSEKGEVIPVESETTSAGCPIVFFSIYSVFAFAALGFMMM